MYTYIEEMDEEMEDTVMLTFTAIELDLDYEFDAARYFDLSREESIAEAREAELWFESAESYPPSPFATKLVMREDILLENVTTSPKTKGLEKIVLLDNDSDIGMGPEISAMNMSNTECQGMNGRMSNDLLSCIFNQSHCIRIPAGLTFYNHLADPKTKRNTTAKPSVLRTSTLMKPTASQLAKQNQRRQVTDSSARLLKLKNNEKSLNISCGMEGQAAKRQKLDGGHLRKVATTNQPAHLVHKEPKKDGNNDGSYFSHSRLRLTIPREPDLLTSHRAHRMRQKESKDPEHITSTAPTFRALPLNKKILEAPSLLLPKRSTPQLPEFQEFHLKTSERAMQHNYAVSSSSVRCNNSKVLHKPSTVSIAECSNRDFRRSNVVDAPMQEGCEIVHKFKALPLNKKIFSSKGDIGVFRNRKRETTKPMEFNFHTEQRVQHDPPVELFNKLALTSELRPSADDTRFKLPRSTCIFSKGSKENRFGFFQQESEVKELVKEKQLSLKVKQIPSLGEGVDEIGALSSMSRSSGIR